MSQNYVRAAVFSLAVWALSGLLYLHAHLSGGLANARIFGTAHGLALVAPGIAAAVMIYVTKSKQKIRGFRLGPWKYYVACYMAGPFLFMLVYGLTLLFAGGRLAPGTMKASVPEAAGWLSLPRDMRETLFLSLTWGPVIRSMAGIAGEYGWRGYLHQLLQPLAPWKNHLIVGTVWGLTQVPLVIMGIHHPGHPLLGILLMLLLCAGLSLVLGHLRILSGSFVLTGFARGVFAAQELGVWRMTVRGFSPLVGGIYGLIGAGTLLVFGVLLPWVLPAKTLNSGASPGHG